MVNMKPFGQAKKDIAKIYNIDRSVVFWHINNLFKSEELDESEVCVFFAHTTKSGAHKKRHKHAKWHIVISLKTNHSI